MGSGLPQKCWLLVPATESPHPWVPVHDLFISIAVFLFDQKNNIGSLWIKSELNWKQTEFWFLVFSAFKNILHWTKFLHAMQLKTAMRKRKNILL